MVKMMIVANPKAGTALGDFFDPTSMNSIVTDEHSILQEVPR